MIKKTFDIKKSGNFRTTQYKTKYFKVYLQEFPDREKNTTQKLLDITPKSQKYVESVTANIDNEYAVMTIDTEITINEIDECLNTLKEMANEIKNEIYPAVLTN